MYMPKKKTVKRKSSPKAQKQKNIFLKFIGLFVGLVAILTISLVLTSPNKDAVSRIASTTDLGTFTGVLPCADCEGIRTTITFNLSTDEKSPHTYSETDSYIGRGTIVSTTGTWQYTTSASMPDAVIIELTGEDSVGSKEYYMVVNDDTLEMLSQDKEKITDAPMPLTLTKEN